MAGLTSLTSVARLPGIGIGTCFTKLTQATTEVASSTRALLSRGAHFPSLSPGFTIPYVSLVTTDKGRGDKGVQAVGSIKPTGEDLSEAGFEGRAILQVVPIQQRGLWALTVKASSGLFALLVTCVPSWYPRNRILPCRAIAADETAVTIGASTGAETVLALLGILGERIFSRCLSIRLIFVTGRNVVVVRAAYVDVGTGCRFLRCEITASGLAVVLHPAVQVRGVIVGPAGLWDGHHGWFWLLRGARLVFHTFAVR